MTLLLVGLGVLDDRLRMLGKVREPTMVHKTLATTFATGLVVVAAGLALQAVEQAVASAGRQAPERTVACLGSPPPGVVPPAARLHDSMRADLGAIRLQPDASAGRISALKQSHRVTVLAAQIRCLAPAPVGALADRPRIATQPQQGPPAA